MGEAYTTIHHHAGPELHVLMGPGILCGKADPWSSGGLSTAGPRAGFASGVGHAQQIPGGQPIRRGTGDVFGHHLPDSRGTACAKCSNGNGARIQTAKYGNGNPAGRREHNGYRAGKSFGHAGDGSKFEPAHRPGSFCEIAEVPCKTNCVHYSVAGRGNGD